AASFVGRGRAWLGSLARSLGETVGAVQAQKFVECLAGCKAEQPAQLQLGQMTDLVFFEGQRLERAPLDLARGAEKPGELVGNPQGDFHIGDLTRSAKCT